MIISSIATVFFTLFAVIDILGNIPFIITIHEKIGEIKAGITVLATGLFMCIFLFLGDRVLAALGIDAPSFSMAGSLVFFFMGLEMTLNIEIFKPDADGKMGMFIPLVFPLLAGPGALTTIVALKTQYHEMTILVGIVLNLGLIYLVIRLLHPIERLLGEQGLMVIRKFMGVILLALAFKVFKTNMVL